MFINDSYKNDHLGMLNDGRSWLRGPFIAESGKKRINILCMILDEMNKFIMYTRDW